MKSWFFVAIVALVAAACSGPPAPSSPVADWIDANVTDSPSSPDASVPDAQVPDAALVFQRIPGVDTGFYCAEFREGDKRATRCFLSLPACHALRERGMRERGQTVSDCTPSERAYCFAITHIAPATAEWRCGDTSERCEKDKRVYQREFPHLELGECGPYATLPSPASPHAFFR